MTLRRTSIALAAMATALVATSDGASAQRSKGWNTAVQDLNQVLARVATARAAQPSRSNVTRTAPFLGGSQMRGRGRR